MSRYGRISMSLMSFQMTRVISSPSSSTTGPFTLILGSLDIGVRILQPCELGERLPFRPAYKEPSPRHTAPVGIESVSCDRLRIGHERQRQAPACWPATLQPRWGAPGDDPVE